jgi:branched-chain amino acid transport system ATP-binding protein
MLRVAGVETAYGRLKALHGVSLEVPAGSIVTLIGANGAGKTTLLLTIVGILKPIAGEITFEGSRIDGRPAWEIVKLGIAPCPEGRRVWPQMTVLENLEMGGYTITAPTELRRRIDAVCTHFPILAERQSQKAGSLSGGEQQMLAIARALMARPRLLLLDEPSLGLAPIVVEKLAEIIQGIRRAGTTIVVVEQNAFMALNMADCGYVLEVGRVTLSGPARDLLANDTVRRSYLGI